MILPTFLSNVPHADYHADAVFLDQDRPSLNSSTAFRLVSRSPAHARASHPRLGPIAPEPEETEAQAQGSLLHSLLLGSGPSYVSLDFDSWRTKAAKEARDEAIAAGQTPVLLKTYESALRKAKTLVDAIEAQGARITTCNTEVTALWEEEGGVLCRARMDMVGFNEEAGCYVRDLKMVRDGNPTRFGRTAVSYGYDIQAAAYLRACDAINPQLAGRTRFEFILCETSYPHIVTRVEPSGTLKALGEQRWLRAVRLWKECLESGEWPAYVPHGTVARVEAPEWALSDDFATQVAGGDPAWASD